MRSADRERDGMFWVSRGSLAHICQPRRRNESRNNDWSDEKGTDGPLAELYYLDLGERSGDYYNDQWVSTYIMTVRPSCTLLACMLVCAHCLCRWLGLATTDLGSVYLLEWM